MSFRKKRIVLLSSVAILFLLSILDISFRKEEIFEVFGEQFLNEQKTDAHFEAHQDVTVTSQGQLEISRQDIKEVELSSIGGKVFVKHSQDPVIRLQFTVTASAADTDAANRKRDAVKVEQEVQNGRLTLVAKANGRPIDNDSVSIDYTLLIPDAMKLKIGNENGEVRISGINGDVDASSDRGMMEIVGVKGVVSAKSSNGSLYLTDITGDIDLENRYSQTNVDHTKGAFVFNNQSGQIFMYRIDGKVTGNAAYGSVHLREIAGPVRVHSQGSATRLDHIRGDIQVTSESGDTTLIVPEAEGYKLDAAVNGGRIQTQLPIPVKQENDGEYRVHMNGLVGDGTWNVDVKARSGDIIFHVK